MARSQYDNMGAAVLGSVSGGVKRLLEAIMQKRQSEAAAAQSQADRKQKWEMFREGNSLKIRLKNLDIAENALDRSHEFSLLDRKQGFERDTIEDKQKHDIEVLGKKQKNTIDLENLRSQLGIKKSAAAGDTRLAHDIMMEKVKAVLKGLGVQYDIDDTNPDIKFNFNKYNRGVDSSLYELTKYINGGK